MQDLRIENEAITFVYAERKKIAEILGVPSCLIL